VPGEWADLAACRGRETSAFFPSYGDSHGVVAEFCNVCPVKRECREYGLKYPGLKGIWGGLSDQERRNERRRRREFVPSEGVAARRLVS
jgi:WhiB family redox-sensing transcriptional regulator